MPNAHTMSDRDDSQYRPCVGIMLVNGSGQAFVGNRIDNRESGFWQMPQGGVDPGEELDAAMLRELGEEVGARPEHLEIVARLPETLYYDLPPELQGKMWGGRYCGQRQTWYLVRFTGSDEDIAIDAHDPPEFCEWKWVDPERLPDMIVPFKREVYATIVEGFRGYL